MSSLPMPMERADLPSLACPFCHRSIPEAVMYRHSLWCRQNSTGPLTLCKFNPKHRVLQDEADGHHQRCPGGQQAIRIKQPTMDRWMKTRKRSGSSEQAALPVKKPSCPASLAFSFIFVSKKYKMMKNV